MDSLDPKNIGKHAKVTRNLRGQQNGHASFMLWFTGLSGAGKSTLAHRVEEILFNRGYRTYVLDGDNVRQGLCSDLGFSVEDRGENIRRIGEIGKLFIDAGVITLAAFISPTVKSRASVRSSVAPGDFIEIFCDTPLSICEQRDVKGLYKRARRGEIPEFTGISSPYETPVNPEIVVMAGEESLETCARQIIQYLENTGKIGI